MAVFFASPLRSDPGVAGPTDGKPEEQIGIAGAGNVWDLNGGSAFQLSRTTSRLACHSLKMCVKISYRILYSVHLYTLTIR